MLDDAGHVFSRRQAVELATEYWHALLRTLDRNGYDEEKCESLGGNYRMGMLHGIALTFAWLSGMDFQDVIRAIKSSWGEEGGDDEGQDDALRRGFWLN